MKYKFLRMTGSRGQAIVQYTAIIGIVMLAVVSMGTGIRRTIQAAYRSAADQIGGQGGNKPDPKKGFVDFAVSQDVRLVNNARTENQGTVILNYDESTTIPFSQTNSHYGNPPE